MKKLLLPFIFFFSFSFLFGQDSDEVTDFIKEGIKYHDAGDYGNAVRLYMKALEIAPDSYNANYELSMTYMYSKDYPNALKYADKAIEVGGDNAMTAYVNKGSTLNYMGKVDESLKAFEEAEVRFGANFLLYFNWGLVYFGDKQYAKAAGLFEKGVLENYRHASGHLYLGFSYANMGNKVKALLPLYYFLMLEPGTRRSANALVLIDYLYSENVTQTKEKEITITLDKNSTSSEFATTEMIIPLIIAASKDDKNKNKTESALFAENTQTIFRSLKESYDNRPEKSKSDNDFNLWWDFYTLFFSNMLKAEQAETYCYYIKAAMDEGARTWLHANGDKLSDFEEWLEDMDVIH